MKLDALSLHVRCALDALSMLSGCLFDVNSREVGYPSDAGKPTEDITQSTPEKTSSARRNKFMGHLTSASEPYPKSSSFQYTHVYDVVNPGCAVEVVVGWLRDQHGR